MLRHRRRFGTPWALLLCAGSLPAFAQQGGDLQAQILYAYHAEDANQLSSVIQTLRTRLQEDGGDDALRYHLAHAEYRAGLLAAAAHARAPETAFAACVDQLKMVLEQDVDSVEALSLQSACYANLARFERLEGALLRARAAKRLDAAYELAPDNPRVVYLRALDGLARAKPDGAPYRRAFAELERAAQLFERSPATQVDAPGWGHAEAYLELGRRLEARGDVLGARNWIEKSLIASPDFKAAQRALAALVGRSAHRPPPAANLV